MTVDDVVKNKQTNNKIIFSGSYGVTIITILLLLLILLSEALFARLQHARKYIATPPPPVPPSTFMGFILYTYNITYK